MDTLLTLLQSVTGITFLAGILLALLAWYYFRHSRRDPFWRQRRNAGLRGFRYSVLAAVALALSAAFCMVTLAVSFMEGYGQEALANAASSNLMDSPTAPLTLTLLPSPDDATLELTEEVAEAQLAEAQTAEAQSTQAPTVPVPTLPPAATFTPIPSLTPTPVILPTAASAFVEIWAVDTQISSNFRPIQPSTIFASNTRRLYFYLNYRGIEQGTTWERTLLKDGEVLRQDRQLWGMTPLEGESFFFFGSDVGFEPGNYELQVRFGEENPLRSSISFTIVAP